MVGYGARWNKLQVYEPTNEFLEFVDLSDTNYTFIEYGPISAISKLMDLNDILL